ncbi:MAG: isoleucine--tRNA ligase [Candidatus Gracilibacteria bacterium]
MKKPSFNPVDARKSLPKMEHEMLEFWEREKIFEKSLENRKNGEKYVFFDGPPFANGLPHYGHILANALKDAVTRYWTMRGYYVPRVNGWDCHGLPVEYEIEKELKLTGRKDIEKMGVAEFNSQCRKSVFRYTAEWEKLLKRIGRWVDFGNSYATLQNNYMESIWWVFKSIWEKGMVYEGFKSMHICPRCETPLSNFEVTQGYKDVTDTSVTLKFKLLEGKYKGAFVLAWTTTPWTLPGNMFLAMNPEIEYVLVESEGEKFILAKNRVEAVLSEVSSPEPDSEQSNYKVEQINIKDLAGTHYEPLFPFYKDRTDCYRVLLADFVTVEDGTGVVHIAPAFGEDDLKIGQREKVDPICHVKMDGTFKPEVGPWAGKAAYDQSINVNIKDYLKTEEKLFASKNFKHSYPHCWRCDTRLLNYSTRAWFIRVTDIKEKMLKNNKKIHWVPDHIQQGRFGKWLEGARDWNISRNRFWGCPIPVWQCECGKQKCVGSVKELGENSIGKKLPQREGELDLHKPYIDDIELVCDDCGKHMKRISEVMDCWFESGSMPYAQLHYPFENKKEFEDNFPANFIAEGLDQTRGWFYTLHVLATTLFDKPAFKNVIVNGILLAANGEKLSKRKKNYPDPSALFENHGVDSTRFFLYTSTAPLAEDVRFSEKHVEELVKKFTLTLWNTYSFFVTYANIDGWTPVDKVDKSTNKLDEWILSELNALVEEVTFNMEEYNLTKSTRPMMAFVDNLSNWYVRRSRRRFWKSESDSDKSNAYATLHTVLVTFTKLLAPFMPFVADTIYKNLTGEVSVHLTDWPTLNKKLIKQELNREIRAVRTIVSLALKLRSKNNIKVRQPLATLLLALPKEVPQKLVEAYRDVILEELNVKDIQFEKEGKIATICITADSRKIGPKFGPQTQKIIELTKKGDFRIESDGSIVLPKEGKAQFTLTAEEVQVGYKGSEGFDVESEDGILVSLDTKITQELLEEGYVRDIVRFVQELRKKADFGISDRIYVYIDAPKEIQEAVTRFADFIQRETLAIEIQEGGDFEWDAEDELEIDGKKVKLGVRK